MPRGLLLCIIVAAAAASQAACRDRLPDQDLRILSATPVARVSADILWKDYASDADAADDTYWGKPIVVTGTVSALSPEDAAVGPAGRYVEFAPAEGAIVRAHLLDEQAEEILSGASEKQRLMLKCYCEGRPETAGGAVVLKSCVRP